MDQKQKQRVKEPEIRFPFSNQTIFAMVMNDEGRCKGFLEKIFPDRTVSQIKLSRNTLVEGDREARAEAEKTILNTPFHKSVRLDVLFQGDDIWYDIEFQAENADDIPKRSRYYHGMIDTHLMKPGEKYEKLRPCYVIFLCRFDLFGKGAAVYQFQNYDVKKQLLLGDESYTIILNSKATADSIPGELKALFGYINEGRINPGRDALVDRIHQKVLELNGDEKLMGVMTLEMEYKMRESRAEDRGMQRGLEQGLRQGIQAFVLGNRKAGNDEAKIKTELMEWFNLNEQEADGYLQEFKN